jgi:hypothetical protein
VSLKFGEATDWLILFRRAEPIARAASTLKGSPYVLNAMEKEQLSSSMPHAYVHRDWWAK